jgi:K(+)-stimulated pyrophosphate-energized sodium pump
VTQLALLLALGLIGLVLSFVFGRLEVKRGPVSATVKRLEGALERASVAVLRLGALRGLALLVVPAAGLTGFALVGHEPGPVSPIGSAAFCAVALLGGALTAILQARLTLGLGARAASSAAAAAARGSARAMRPLLRASGAAAVFSEGLGLFGVAAAFASLYAVLGGFAAPGGNPALAAAVVKLLPSFALGAAVCALALAREGSVAASAARIGGAHTAEREASLEAGDPRDPALLAGLVGHQVGELLPRSLTTYVCGLSATVSAALLAVSGAAGDNALTCLVLVLVVRAFGSVGSVCGVLAARATDEEAPSRALFRGQASALLVALFGLGSSLYWLQREHFGVLLGAGALGLFATALVSQLAWLPLRRGTSTARHVLEARASGDAAAIVRAAGSGLSRLWPALLLPALALAVGERFLGQSAPAGLLIVSFVAGAIALSPFALAVSGFGLLVDQTRGVAALARLDVESRARKERLDEASTVGRAMGSTHASLVLAASLLLGLVALLGSAPLKLTGSLGLAALATAAGVSLVLLFGARAAGSAVTGARLVATEVERQLRELPRQQGVTVVPADFTPSYRACVDASFAAARGASMPEAALLLLTPFLLGLLLRAGSQPPLTEPLIGFGVAAVLSGVVYALAARGTQAVLAELRRRTRSTESGSGSLAFSTYGELVGVTAAASVEALVCALALTVLCLAALLS